MPLQEVSHSREIGGNIAKPSAVDFYSTISHIRNLITIALASIKELKGQAVEKYGAPGMRIILGEIISCLGSARSVIDHSKDIITT